MRLPAGALILKTAGCTNSGPCLFLSLSTTCDLSLRCGSGAGYRPASIALRRHGLALTETDLASATEQAPKARRYIMRPTADGKRRSRPREAPRLNRLMSRQAQRSSSASVRSPRLRCAAWNVRVRHRPSPASGRWVTLWHRARSCRAEVEDCRAKRHRGEVREPRRRCVSAGIVTLSQPTCSQAAAGSWFSRQADSAIDFASDLLEYRISKKISLRIPRVRTGGPEPLAVVMMVSRVLTNIAAAVTRGSPGRSWCLFALRCVLSPQKTDPGDEAAEAMSVNNDAESRCVTVAS